MNVAENLYSYLKHNDKAELIGFGTFYVKTSSAKFNDLTGTVLPPKREVFFSKELSDDRSFVSFMAKNEFISEDTAYTWIKQYSDSLNEKIQSGRSVTLGKLGKIEKGLLEDYTFTSAQDLNLLDNSFALGNLKNVQTFDSEEETVELIHTKPSSEETSVQQEMPKIFADKKSEIEKQIEEARQLKQEERINETQSQTEQRIIRHSQAVVESETEKPENAGDKEVKTNIDNVSLQDKTQQTVERAAQFKENVIVEDIQPAKQPEKEKKAKPTVASAQDDALKKQAEEIVKKHSKHDKVSKRVKRTNKRKRNWLVLLWIVIALLLLCGAFVFAHWFGLLKDIKFLKPVTDRLSYYIPVREAKPVEAEEPLKEPVVETVTEESYTGEIEYEEPDASLQQTPFQAQTTNNNSQKTKANANRNKAKSNKNNTDSQQETVKPQEETVVEDNSPIVVQNHSKLGFDVVSGSYADKSKAQEQARKARRLGYDGYVITKIKNGTPIYYASYGSRRTNADATDLCTMIKSRLGGDFYIISR